MNKFKYQLLTINNFKFVKQVKWIISLFALVWLRAKQCFFKRRNSVRKKRLFSTTGNISLINALAIIKQLGDEECDDFLIIDSFSGGYNFWKNNYDIAKLHNFKSIKMFYNIRYMTALRLANWTDFDEIYTLNHEAPIPALNELYPDANMNLFDEGCGSLVMHSDKVKNIKDLKSFYTNKYINKIDFIGLTQDIATKITPVDKNLFEEILQTLARKYPLDINYNEQDKNILFCGIYWQTSGLSEEEFIIEQNKQIEELVNAGYKVLFKPHPRQTNLYGMDKNPNVIFVNSVLPVEIYDWDVLAVVGMSCSTLIHLPHYHNMPAFSNVISDAVDCSRDSYAACLIRYFIKEYTPDYKELIKLDVKNTSREELKIQIKEIYDNFLKDKPLLSQNKNVEVFAKKYGSN